MSEPASRAPSAPPQAAAKGEQPTHCFPDGAWTPEELKRMDRIAPVDGEAAVAWLLGEGPDPWPEESR